MMFFFKKTIVKLKQICYNKNTVKISKIGDENVQNRRKNKNMEK